LEKKTPAPIKGGRLRTRTDLGAVVKIKIAALEENGT
jgi:hypothetical protein